MLHAHGGGVYMGHSQRPAEMVREGAREVTRLVLIHVVICFVSCYSSFFVGGDWVTLALLQGES